MSQVPSHLKYTEEHEWIDVDEENVVTIGITDFAQSELGDIVYVELPQEGDSVSERDSFGTIEAVKTVEDLYSPVTGNVVEVNHALQEQPTLINTNPYDDGWIVRIHVTGGETPTFLTAAEYKERLGEGA